MTKILPLFPTHAEPTARMNSTGAAADAPPDFDALLAELARDADAGGKLVHVERVPARAARHAAPERPLAPELTAALGDLGVERLYLHQAEAV